MFDMVLNRPLKINSDKYHLISTGDTFAGTSSGHPTVKTQAHKSYLELL